MAIPTSAMAWQVAMVVRAAMSAVLAVMAAWVIMVLQECLPPMAEWAAMAVTLAWVLLVSR